MTVQLRSWWQRAKKSLAVVGIIVAVALAVVVIVAIIGGYLFHWGWIGLGPYTSSPNYQRGKTFWDWLQLFATLGIPIVVVYASARLNHDLQIARNQQEASRQATQDQQRQETLQTYLSKMSELLQNKDLNDPAKAGVEIRALARAWTLMASRVLDANRKGILLQFLSESGLINIDKTAVDLRWADLSGVVLNKAILSETNLFNVDLSGAILNDVDFEKANLCFANLSGANLRGAHFDKAYLPSVILSGANLEKAYFGEIYLNGAILRRANLRGTDLRGTDLSGADLSGANLSGADLSGANLSGADLSGANLKGAKYNTKAISTKEPTQWPQGFDPKAAGAICVDR